MSMQVTRWSPVILLVISFTTRLSADEEPKPPIGTGVETSESSPDEPKSQLEISPMGPAIELKGLTRLSPDEDVWIDPMRKLVVAQGQVCLRRGVLELFACPRGTKEHESVVSVNAKAFTIHAGLLAVGAIQGRPVQFAPEYKAATGTEVEVWVLWKDKDGKNQKVPAQQWIRDIKTGKAMKGLWVFAGSSFYVDEMTGKKYYQADGSGDLICVSNFSTATLDLPVKSSAEAADLLYESFTEKIPARGTQVRLVFIPRIKAVKEGEAAAKKAN